MSTTRRPRQTRRPEQPAPEPDAQVEPLALRSPGQSLANLTPELTHILHTPLSRGTQPPSFADILASFDTELAKYGKDGDLAARSVVWRTIYAEIDAEQAEREAQAAA